MSHVRAWGDRMPTVVFLGLKGLKLTGLSTPTNVRVQYFSQTNGPQVVGYRWLWSICQADPQGPQPEARYRLFSAITGSSSGILEYDPSAGTPENTPLERLPCHNKQNRIPPAWADFPVVVAMEIRPSPSRVGYSDLIWNKPYTATAETQEADASKKRPSADADIQKAAKIAKTSSVKADSQKSVEAFKDQLPEKVQQHIKEHPEHSFQALLGAVATTLPPELQTSRALKAVMPLHMRPPPRYEPGVADIVEFSDDEFEGEEEGRNQAICLVRMGQRN